MTDDSVWIERVVYSVARQEARQHGKTLSIDEITILGQVKGVWIVKVQGHEQRGVSWKKRAIHLSISGSEALPDIDEATEAQIEQVTND